MLHFQLTSDEPETINRIALALQPPADSFEMDDIIALADIIGPGMSGRTAATAETPQPEPSGTHYLTDAHLPQSSRSEQVVRNYVINAVVEVSGKSRGAVTEAVIEIERHSDRTALQWVDEGGLSTLLALLKSLLS